MKNIILFLTKTHIGRIIIAGFLIIIGAIFSRNGDVGELIRNPDNYEKFDIFQWIMIIGLLIMAIYFIIMAAYAWIINPIRNRKTKK